MTNTRPHGAIGIVLDPQRLLDQVCENYPEYADHLTHGPTPQMLIPVDRGIPAIVNGEGVGTVADEDGQSIRVYFSHGFQYVALTLTLEQIAAAGSGERVDLAEGIRTFGSRLEINHRTWFDRYDHTHHAAQLLP